ncbi:MAG TPA: ATP synthase F1 subunit delta [Candidatus Omnitrophota bacterium]|nr:ATP synthase F1 subunit delta [Candidatus Omnitrophota bacterium]
MKKDPAAARRYASALFALEKSAKRTQKALEALTQAEKLFTSSPDLGKIFGTATISRGEKENLIEKLLAPASPEIKSFLKLLVRKNRFGLLPDIREFFQELYHEDEGIEEVRLVTPFEPDKETEERIRKAVQKKLNRKVLLKKALDPSVIGGIAIYTKTSVFDGTLSQKLKELRQCLTPQKGSYA